MGNTKLSMGNKDSRAKPCMHKFFFCHVLTKDVKHTALFSSCHNDVPEMVDCNL